MPILLQNLAKPTFEGQAEAARFHSAYQAHLKLAEAAAAAGLHDDALSALRFGIECFFKCIYQCAMDLTYESSIWTDESLKRYRPRYPQEFSHDIPGLIGVLEALTDLRDASGFKELRTHLPSLPTVDDRYKPRNHDGAQPRYEMVKHSFQKFLADGAGHLQ